jgi:hypothetical protein
MSMDMPSAAHKPRSTSGGFRFACGLAAAASCACGVPACLCVCPLRLYHGGSAECGVCGPRTDWETLPRFSISVFYSASFCWWRCLSIVVSHTKPVCVAPILTQLDRTCTSHDAECTLMPHHASSPVAARYRRRQSHGVMPVRATPQRRLTRTRGCASASAACVRAR